MELEVEREQGALAGGAQLGLRLPRSNLLGMLLQGMEDDHPFLDAFHVEIVHRFYVLIQQRSECIGDLFGLGA